MKNITLLLIVLLFFGCSTKESNNSITSSKISVVTTLFPLYDFTKSIGGEEIEVSLLLPPGIEPHSFEPSPRDMLTINRASLFIYLGKSMEPWASKLKTEGVSLSVSDSISIPTYDEHDEHEGHEGHENCVHHDDDSKHSDPHIWVDPVLAIEMVKTIEAALSKADTAHATRFKERANVLISRLDSLHNSIESALSDCKTKTILYGGHFAFGYFAKRYGLEHESPYMGFSPNAEPTPKAVKNLIDAVEEAGVSILFVEELVEPRLAKVIAEETGVSLETLHGVHNIAKSDTLDAMHYVDLMYENLQKLKKGLQCK